MRRALDVISTTLRSLGHHVIDWYDAAPAGSVSATSSASPTTPPSTTPPSLEELCGIAVKAFLLDAGVDVHKAFALSGEKLFNHVVQFYGTEPDSEKEKRASELAAVNVEKREAQKAFMEYWNESKNRSGTGRPVDVIICPPAPFCPAIPGTYLYYTFSGWISALDYTCVVVPVINSDKNIDKKDPNFKPLSEQDTNIQALYDPDVFDGMSVGLQLVGRRFEEEKMITIADYIGKALKKQQQQRPDK
eukprot:TRINITY_DN15728_c0_g1_i1.p1 TRINITY_DN15728_c0_g1~~TRINITY_DN15728_c0_g1_i1.p1  ORF type:complete len:247 (-),score=51.64 TRINITY_DN15728_c0_g1_i1:20-760(-)